MNKPGPPDKRSRPVMWIILGVVAIGLGVYGQLAVRRVQRDSDIELAATQVELARVEKIYTDYKTSSDEEKELAKQLHDDERAFERELRSFKRPSMRSALLENLKLPQKNCVVSSGLTIENAHKYLLIYSSDPGQQLVIPVWQQKEKFDDVRPEPKHRVLIDVPPGELNILEFGLVAEYRKEPYFIVRFAEQEKLRIELTGFKVVGDSCSAGQHAGCLLPGVITRGRFEYNHSQPNKILDLLRQGIWMRQHNVRVTLADAKTDVTGNLAFCLYWKSSDPLHATDSSLRRLPLDADDPDQVQHDPDSGLYRITPPAPSETNTVSE